MNFKPPLQYREVFDPAYIDLCVQEHLPRDPLLRGDLYVDTRWPTEKPTGRKQRPYRWRYGPMIRVHHWEYPRTDEYTVWIPRVDQLFRLLRDSGVLAVQCELTSLGHWVLARDNLRTVVGQGASLEESLLRAHLAYLDHREQVAI